MIIALLLAAVFLSILKAQVENSPANLGASTSLVRGAPKHSPDRIEFSDWVLRR
jgi:hypothetical protein